jgi:hypothetical protein
LLSEELEELEEDLELEVGCLFELFLDDILMLVVENRCVEWTGKEKVVGTSWILVRRSAVRLSTSIPY